MWVRAAFGCALLVSSAIVACGSSSDGQDSSAFADSDAGAGFDGSVVGLAEGGCLCELDAGQPTPAWSPRDIGTLLLWMNLDGLPDAEGTLTGSGSDDGGLMLWAPDNSHGPHLHPFGVHGYESLQFVAAEELELDTTSTLNPTPPLVLGSDDFLVEIVLSAGTCASPGCGVLSIIDGADAGLADSGGINESGLAVTGSTISAAFRNGAITDTTSVAFATGPHVVGLRRTSASTAEARIDGTAAPFALNASYVFSSTAELAFGRGLDGRFLDGDVAEIVVARAPSDSDVAQVEAYLKSKYGL
jgi:hypothetical protein